jgi:hypothetical protein
VSASRTLHINFQVNLGVYVYVYKYVHVHVYVYVSLYLLSLSLSLSPQQQIYIPPFPLQTVELGNIFSLGGTPTKGAGEIKIGDTITPTQV